LRPSPPSAFSNVVPEELRAYSQYVIWRHLSRKGKLAKVPHNPWTGLPASVANPDHWSEWRVAQQTATANGFDGIGFVFAAADPFAGLDLDRCRDAASGVVESWAQSVIDELSTYTEVSPSGTGVKLWLRGAVPGGGRRSGQVELYSERRFFTLTGQHVAGTPTTINDRQAELLQLLRRLPAAAAPTPPTHVLTTPAKPRLVAPVVCTGVGGVVPEERQLQAVLDKAQAAANSDKFERLWSGDTSEYDGDQSRADLALCRMLAYWCDHDPVLVDALFRQSGLMREKWDSLRGQTTYGQRTIQATLGRW
jgi:primase-polymerase (primpol)-like protein